MMIAFSATAQFTAGPQGFHITANTLVVIDNLTLVPGSDLTIDNRSISVSGNPVAGVPTGSISRVYEFSTPVIFTGAAGIIYDPANELNGNDENDLEISYSGTAGGVFAVTSSSTKDPVNHHVYTTFTAQELSSVTATNANSALPVTLLEFMVTPEIHAAMISWKTTQETHSSRFEVQRSADAKSWEVLGSIAAQGESMTDQNYLYTDEQPLWNRTSYYRLKMIDLDGSFGYSNIRTLFFKESFESEIYPNPTAERFTVKTKDWSKIRNIQLLSPDGNVVYESIDLPASGSTNEISLKAFPPGTYLVRINQINGTSRSMKVIRQ